MNPRVVLGAKNVKDPVYCVANAFNSGGELKGTTHGCDDLWRAPHSLPQYELHIRSHVHCVFSMTDRSQDLYPGGAFLTGCQPLLKILCDNDGGSR